MSRLIIVAGASGAGKHLCLQNCANTEMILFL